MGRGLWLLSRKEKLLKALMLIEERLGGLPHGLTLKKVEERVCEEDIWEESEVMYFVMERHPWIMPPMFGLPPPLYQIRKMVYAVDVRLIREIEAQSAPVAHECVWIISDDLIDIGYDPHAWVDYFLAHLGEEEGELEPEKIVEYAEAYLNEELDVFSDELSLERLNHIKNELISALRKRLREREIGYET